MDSTDKSVKDVRSTMSAADWLELKELVRGAEGALLSGQLGEWQHADCTSFHVLASALLDINARLARLEPATDQPMEDAPLVIVS